MNLYPFGYSNSKLKKLTNKEKYRELCEKETLIPIYMRDWWLDCNCGDKWDVLFYENKGEIEAFMTYYQPYPGVISMPMYSQSMGIWFNPSIAEERYDIELRRKQNICELFLDKLPTSYSYLQNFNTSFTDWLPFYWRKYKQTTRYNYVVPYLGDINKVWDNLGKVKKCITRASNRYNLKLDENLSIDTFFDLNKKTFEKQGMLPPEMHTLEKIINASKQRKQGAVWGAVDDNGKVHAALFLVWQENTVYGIANGRDPNYINSEALSFLTWEAINFAYSFGASYDFQGSMIKGVESFFLKLGGVQTPYFCIYKGRKNMKYYFNALLTKIKNR